MKIVYTRIRSLSCDYRRANALLQSYQNGIQPNAIHSHVGFFIGCSLDLQTCQFANENTQHMKYYSMDINYTNEISMYIDSVVNSGSSRKKSLQQNIKYLVRDSISGFWLNAIIHRTMFFSRV